MIFYGNENEKEGKSKENPKYSNGKIVKIKNYCYFW